MGYIKTRYLYKIATAAEHAEWVAAGSITGSGLDLADGFFHSSDGVMVKTVASMFFKGAQRSFCVRVTRRRCPLTLTCPSAACAGVEGLVLLQLDHTTLDKVEVVDAETAPPHTPGTYLVHALPDGCGHIFGPAMPLSVVTATFPLPWNAAAESHTFPEMP